MSLRIWLPLNGTLKNQGLGEDTLTVEGSSVIVNNSGKMSKCYSFGTDNGYLDITTTEVKKLSNFCSVAFWVKILSFNTNYSTIFSCTTINNSWAQQILTFQRDSNTSTYTFHIADGTNSTTNVCKTDNLQLDTWYHFVLTMDVLNKQMKIYKNGSLITTYNTSIVPDYDSVQYFRIGKSHNGYQGHFLLNDFRLYDNILSDQQIKQISQGLVLHFPLNGNGCAPINLIKNGFGELGSENWTNTNNIFTDIPSGQPDIKKSYKDNWTKEYIRIYRNHTYKFSCWVKGTSTSGYTYPSLLSYDVDKKAIYHFNCPDGFDLDTMTTLTKELKRGDTKIYVSSLANWNASSGHYYNYAAIFSYKDSTGHLYPDGTYTQNIASFGSGTNAKTNLDKTNNIITLNNAYSGSNVPIGTKICAATAGASYIYPLGAITLSTVTDWTYKERVSLSSEINRLKYAKYVRIYAYSNCYQAGISLIDMSVQQIQNNDTVYDISGFGNNGVSSGDVTIDPDTPKYSVSTHMGATTAKIHISDFPTSGFGDSYSFAWWAKVSNVNPMHWGFYNGIRLNGMYTGRVWNTSDGTKNPLYIPGTTTQVPTPTINVWHHWVMTGDGTTCKVYQDGEFWGQAKTYKSISGTSIYINGWNHVSDYASDNMNISDFRIYATALSAEDVKSLYNNKAYIDENNIIHGEIRE